MTTNHYIVLVVAAFLIYWVFVSLVDMFENQKRLRAKKTWGKLNKISERLKVEKDLKVWESLGNSNQKKENIK